jgi:hypothetical protein
MRNSVRTFAALIVAIVGSVVAVPELSAATVTPTVDTPLSFRATFTGLDTDATTIDGNDFQVFTFAFWTVLVNLRGDAVDTSGNAVGFYEIQLTRTGSAIADPTAPGVNTYLFYAGLAPGVTLTDVGVSSQPHGAGAEYLTTSVNILYDQSSGTVQFDGSIAGDSDLDGDGVMDTDQTPTDTVVKTLQTLKDAGVITGKEMGQIIRQTKQPIK